MATPPHEFKLSLQVWSHFALVFVQLELSLAERERQSLEKELLVEQVTRLSEPLGEQVENCRRDSLTVAKKVGLKARPVLA